MVTASAARRDVVFRAIADPTRREILRLLRGRQLSVGDLASHFTQSRPAISKHLRLLRSAGLVATHERGAARLCELNAAPLRAVDAWIGDYKTFWRDSLRSLKRHAEDNR
jgi:DNA-binding transcriptional ArsR family regulator